MKAIILAAGYHTRLEKDLLDNDTYAALRGKPKALLPVKDGVLLDYLFEQIKEGGVEDIYIVTNGKYYAQFCSWARDRDFDLNHIINDGTFSNETRLGALVDLELVVQKHNFQDTLLVIAGDIVFFPGFQLASMMAAYQAQPRVLITVYSEPGDTSKRGIVEVDAEERVASFIEKPAAGTTTSRLASTACYILPAESVPQIENYLQQTSTLKERDAPGHFIAWLHKKVSVYTFKIPGRFDLGSVDDYQNMVQEI